MPNTKGSKRASKKASGVAKLQRQVTALTKRVGYPERFDTQLNGRYEFGAFDTGFNREGSLVVDLTPNTLHSAYANVGGVGGRTGKAINLKSFQLRMRITSGANRMNGGRVDLYLVRQPQDQIALTSPGSATQMAGVGHFLEPDPWISEAQGYSCYTTQSLRQMDDANYGKFRVIAKRTVKFPMEPIGSVSAVGVKNVDIFQKVNFPIEYALGSEDDQDAVKNKIHLIAVCDGGNIAGGTGFLLQYNVKYFYTDN